MRIFRNIENKKLYYFEINYGFGNYFRTWVAYPFYLNKDVPMIEIGRKLDTQHFNLEFEV